MIRIFWLIVVDQQTGYFHNAQIASKNEADTFEDMKYKFEQKFPKYIVIHGGPGLDSRPTFYEGLPQVG